MDKVKSFLKGEDTSSSKAHSSSTGSSSTTARDAARDVESAATGHHSTSTTGTSSSAPRSSGTTTEVYEDSTQTMAPAVEKETVKRLREEQVQQVVDRERHQDHYHTTVQPLVDREVVPTQHKSQQAETQYSEIEHDDAARTKAALEAEAAKFQSTRTDLGTSKTTTNLGTVESETVHHHMHETVQPVIEREIIQPSVVHTTVPIKEVHHDASHIHETSVAAPISVSEFEKMQGSSTTGSTTHGSSTQGTNY